MFGDDACQDFANYLGSLIAKYINLLQEDIKQNIIDLSCENIDDAEHNHTT